MLLMEQPTPTPLSSRPSFFSTESVAIDPLYASIREGDADHTREARILIESFWQAAAPYVDHDIQSKAAVSFHPHFWELYLTASLLRAGLPLVPRAERRVRGRGPDLQLTRPNVWIEAIAATPGNGPDAVPDGEGVPCRPVPDDQIKLRILTAIDEKFKKFQKYVSDGTIGPSESCVVAVNTGLAQQKRGDLEPPRIVRCLFPFGHEVIEISPRDGRVVGRRHEYQPAVMKRSGATVPTTGFETPGWARVSAVIHSAVDVFNGTTAMGREFVVVHNPQATNPLPHGLFKLGTEYWAEGQSIRRHHWWQSEPR